MLAQKYAWRSCFGISLPPATVPLKRHNITGLAFLANSIFWSLYSDYYIKIAKMVDTFLNKKYKLASSENFDEFMKAIGVGLITRKMGNAVTPVVDLQKEGDEYTLSSSSTFKNVITKFKSGVEFDQETPDGRKVKSTITVNGNVLEELQKDPSGKDTTIKREFTDDEVKMTMTCDNITAVRVYKVQS